ncbi:MAG: 3-phosphoshikimate 1-carboxyvinyltransferase [Saprospiraceae bacterium]|jgi:3-phosphoshikimate 1-carboxyvinyltransferase
MSIIRVSHPSGIVNGKVRLDGSKSISNRALIIRALSGENFKIEGLSTSDDTETLERLLNDDGIVYDVHHAGTTFRFLTAYLALQEETQVLTGSERMLQRPIGPLVAALNSLGCNIKYLGEEGYPPLEISGPGDMAQLKEVSISAGISSQYISALILIAPTLPNGLTINLEGAMVSESYLKMTLATVGEFGIVANYDGQKIEIAPQEYSIKDYVVEADWSAASYHFAIAALAKESNLVLEGLYANSTQGDAAITQISESIGVTTNWEENIAHLSNRSNANTFSYDFINQPDIAQTIAVICAATGMKTDFSGLKTLRIKETDRIYALDTEFKKVGSSFELLHTDEDGKEHYGVGEKITATAVIPRFETYKDHRMAMAFGPLALLFPIEINEPEVVTKSYPAFWEDLKKLGFQIEEVSE